METGPQFKISSIRFEKQGTKPEMQNCICKNRGPGYSATDECLSFKLVHPTVHKSIKMKSVAYL